MQPKLIFSGCTVPDVLVSSLRTVLALEAKLEVARRNLLMVLRQAAPALQSTREVEGQDKSWFDGLFTTRKTR